MHKVQKTLSLSDTQFVSTLFGKEWQLALKAPPLPPKPTIHAVSKNHPLYTNTLQCLPDDMKSRVFAVRTGTVPSRKGLYLKAKQNLGVGERVPIYHGTAEPWRATQIALNGFDLNLKLNGRALGDGVYTTSDPNTANGYARGSGSIVVMRGLLSTDITPASSDVIFVYTKPEQLLCEAIVDFSADTSGREAAADAAADEEEAEARELAALKRDMKQREASHRVTMTRDWRQMLQGYLDRLQGWQRQIPKGNKGAAEREMLAHKVELEQKQFESRLPIYLHKGEVVQQLRARDVLFVSAPTGTGKSTQLPQYIVDEVFPNDTRRVAVLQPKRVNCTSLAARVASERGGVVGEEVGYSMGGGAVCTSEQTRIEFITHGLFACMSLNGDLRAKYCAVVLDEAHERTIEVDMSLALIRRALRGEGPRKDTSKELSFKVVVCSATLSEDTVDTLKEYVDPDCTRSAVVELPSHSFPVHVMYRDQALLQQDDSTTTQGNVMTSAAVDTALQLFKQTDRGNILVFLPGHHHLSLAFDCFHRYLEGEAGHSINTLEHSLRFNTEKKETVGVFKFHGRLSATQRNIVLNYADHGYDRIIVFATIVAETGITIPDCRYVVDSGLERTVRWNAELGCNEMRTALASRSSLEQRKGRAGRTASGVCVRLYSKEMFEEAQQAHPPGVTEKNVQTVLLRLLHEQEKGNDIRMPEEIPQSAREEATGVLQELGAVSETGEVTREGKFMLDLGVDFRLASFLLACDNLGCLTSGSIIVAMATTTGTLTMLPLKPDSRNKSPLKPPLEEYFDCSGDHVTLLNIFKGYKAAKSKTSWCIDHDVPHDTMKTVQANLDSILERLSSRGCSLKDDPEKTAEHGGTHSCILRSLCVGFFDHIGVLKIPFQPESGVTRLLPAAQVGSKCEALNQFVQDVGPRCAQASAVPEADEVLVLVDRRSALHNAQEAADRDDADPGDGSMVVFHSQMMVDSARYPKVQLVSYISSEDLSDISPGMRKEIERSKRKFSCVVRKVPLSKKQWDVIRSHMSVFMSQLRRMHPNAGISVDTSDHPRRTLVVSAPESSIDHIMDKVERKLETAETEDVLVELPEGMLCKHISSKMKKLKADLEALLQESDCLGPFNVCLDFNANAIKITAGGDAKCQLALLIGRVHSFLATHSNSHVTLSMTAEGSEGRAIVTNPRYRQLATSATPQIVRGGRNNMMLLLSHHLIWQCKCTVYGGMVRDWVIRNEAANDIDCLLPNMSMMVSVKGTIERFASRLGLHKVEERQQPNSYMIRFGGTSGKDIRVELVDPLLPTAAPHCDCSAGNVCVNAKGVMAKKAHAGGNTVTLAECITHIKKKQFVCFLDWNAPQNAGSLLGRVKDKYLDRGWSLLNQLPTAQMRQLQSQAEYSNWHRRGQLQFDPKYTGLDWSKI
ncbi:hypothetical protein KIPB_005499 [Kipferlia bialata]|uniref:Uncharacterized protein n=1 Tax=Kipferlia bialata TaxID=797122 RepID=A0A9K3GHJ1_9EUKA|nr:hypothetical protein KIPB_003556 [Kipferlia bialata]GIQ84068.1 hypothetical protein KIPB_005499 [Kipferlia bialata]|eukprot:g3556.t1